MRLQQLFETAEHDAEAGALAHRTALAISRAIYGAAKPVCEAEIGTYGDMFVFDADALGASEINPALRGMCICIGTRDPRRVTPTGMLMMFGETILGKYKQGILIQCLPHDDFNLTKARKAVGSLGVLNILQHEIVHAMDADRAPGMFNVMPRSDDSHASYLRYLNHPAEFNARFHDFASTLTALAAEPPDSLRDYFDLSGLSGDFETDLKKFVDADSASRTFWKGLSNDRRRALLRRLYKLHRHVMDMVNDAPSNDNVAAAA